MMKKSIFQFNPSVGLDICDSTIRAVCMDRLLGKMVLKEFGEIPIAKNKPQDQATIDAIVKLYEQYDIKCKEVLLHYAGKGIRYLHLDAPLLAGTDLYEWVYHQIKKRLPTTFDFAQLTISFHVIPQTQGENRVFIVFCRTQLIEEKLRLVEQAGCVPVSVSAGSTDYYLSFIFNNQKIINGKTAFIYFENNHIDHLVTEHGCPVYYEEKRNGDNKQLPLWLENVLEECQNSAPIQAENIFLTGEGLSQELIKKKKDTNGFVEIAEPLTGLTGNGIKLSHDFSLAAGLAVKKYFPFYNTIDLLPENRKNVVKRNQEKKYALKIILGVGLSLLVLINSASIFEKHYSDKYELSQEKLLSVNDKVFELQKIRAQQNKLIGTLQNIQKLVTNRSQTALLFEEISRSIPEKVWLEEIMIGNSKKKRNDSVNDNTPQMLLRGWAFDEQHVAKLLKNLEESEYLSQSELLEITRIPAKEVLKRSGRRKIALNHFVIVINIDAHTINSASVIE